jgi:hypothetical protein
VCVCSTGAYERALLATHFYTHTKSEEQEYNITKISSVIALSILVHWNTEHRSENIKWKRKEMEGESRVNDDVDIPLLPFFLHPLVLVKHPPRPSFIVSTHQ